MKIRGDRRCQDCGARWSYYETGTVACPSCGSLHSVGVDEERRLHTASPASLDLTPARDLVEDATEREAAAEAKRRCREYVRRRGFVHAGEVRRLDDTYLVATELAHVADVFGRALAPNDDEELYFVSLLRGADAGDRPDPDEVPESMRDARGLACAEAVRAYVRDLRAYLDEHPDPAAREVLGALTDHVKRVRALEGDVPPETAERLVRIARDVGTYLAEGDEAALAGARDRLDRLG